MQIEKLIYHESSTAIFFAVPRSNMNSFTPEAHDPPHVCWASRKWYSRHIDSFASRLLNTRRRAEVFQLKIEKRVLSRRAKRHSLPLLCRFSSSASSAWRGPRQHQPRKRRPRPNPPSPSSPSWKPRRRPPSSRRSLRRSPRLSSRRSPGSRTPRPFYRRWVSRIWSARILPRIASR